MPSKPTRRTAAEADAVCRPVTSLSVVICAYALERWPDLLRAYASIEVQTVRPLETIVVIDHNEHLLRHARLEFEGKNDVIVLENAGEAGLSEARNTGTAAASGDVVAFIDDDAIADPDWLERLRAAYAGSSALGVGGLIEPVWLAGRPATFPPEFDWVVGCTYRGHPATAAAVRNLIGANMSFRRPVLTAVAGFRSDLGRVGTLPVGCEETELCLRAARAFPDATVIYEPRARVRHMVPAARGSWSYFVRRCYGEGISKRVVARLAGPAPALRTERSYVAKVLSRALARNIAAGLTGERAALGRAVRIVIGVGAAATGYCYESLRAHRAT
jgi:GT2 family glycosyltransferase